MRSVQIYQKHSPATKGATSSSPVIVTAPAHGSTPPPSTLTSSSKWSSSTPHPPRLAACHPCTALSAKHCPRLHKLASCPPLHHPLDLLTEDAPKYRLLCTFRKTPLPAIFEHQIALGLSPPPLHACLLHTPPPASDLGRAHHRHCALP
jgi:hypothetical protein